MTSKSERNQTSQDDTEWTGGEDEDWERLPRREELLIEAIRLVRKALNDEETPSRTTIGNLVQLIKLHKDIMAEDETPTEVELVWTEVEEPLFSES